MSHSFQRVWKWITLTKILLHSLLFSFIHSSNLSVMPFFNFYTLLTFYFIASPPQQQQQQQRQRSSLTNFDLCDGSLSLSRGTLFSLTDTGARKYTKLDNRRLCKFTYYWIHQRSTIIYILHSLCSYFFPFSFSIYIAGSFGFCLILMLQAIVERRLL